jgi:hypothetical protein
MLHPATGRYVCDQARARRSRAPPSEGERSEPSVGMPSTGFRTRLIRTDPQVFAVKGSGGVRFPAACPDSSYADIADAIARSHPSSTALWRLTKHGLEFRWCLGPRRIARRGGARSRLPPLNETISPTMRGTWAAHPPPAPSPAGWRAPVVAGLRHAPAAWIENNVLGSRAGRLQASGATQTLVSRTDAIQRALRPENGPHSGIM